MKKTIALFLLLFAVGCTNTQTKGMEKERNIIDKSDIYYKNNIAYDAYTDKEVNGVIKSQLDKSYIYTEFKAGKKIKEKVIDEYQELVSSIAYDENGLVNGEVISYDSNYNQTSVANYVSGIKNGPNKITEYDETYSEGTFDYGVLDGPYKYKDYYTSELVQTTLDKGFPDNSPAKLEGENHLSIETKVSMDMLNTNEDKTYYNSKAFTGIGYRSNSNGYITEANYYSDGKLLENYLLNDQGIVTEFTKFFDKDNSLKISYYSYEELAGMVYYYNFYQKDNFHGKYAIYYDDGVSFAGNYVDNVLDGEGIYYDRDCKITEIHKYEGNKYSTIAYFDYDAKTINVTGQGEKIDNTWTKTGKWTYYTEEGKLNETIDYSGDQGWSIIYDKDGNKFMEGAVDPVYQMYMGTIYQYTPDGKVSIIYTYENGYLNGETTYYDETGKVKKVEVYDYDVLVEEK